MRLVRERDSGTLQYDWFFNDTRTECVVRETYKDSGAVLEHIAILARAAAGLAPKTYSPFQSI